MIWKYSLKLMLNPLRLISKLIKSNNQRELDRINKIVEKVNSFENAVKNLKSRIFLIKLLNLSKILKTVKI